MPAIEFYYMPESFYCRNVEMVAELVGVTLNKHYINLFTKEQLKDEYKNLNPLHKIPFIIDADLKLNESRAIACYLVNRYMPDENHLYPRDPVSRARVDELLHLDGGVLNQAVTKFLTPQVFGKDPVEDSEKDFRELLVYLDARLNSNGGKKYFLGNDLTLGDVALAATFSFVDAFDYNLDDFESLRMYLQRLKESIPRYGAINSEAVENVRKYIHSNKKQPCV